jgi:DNA-binding beta-propeller fold protein YncE
MAEISFTLNNGNVPNIVYMPTTDPTVNKITLLISSDTALSLRAGTPVPESEAAGGTSSLLYLHIKNLGLSQSELAGLTVSMAGWTTRVFADTQTICFTPSADTTLDKGQVLTATIANFIASGAPSGSSAQLYMNFYRAVPVSKLGLPFTYSYIVSLQAPPSGKLDLHDALSITLSNNTVVQSTYDYPDIPNTLHLTLGPGPNPKVVSAGPKTVFTINFVYASDQYGYGALATVADAFKIQVNAGDRAAGWTITPPPVGAENPGWMLQPLDGQPILGTSATVDFVLSKILTRFQAGPTLMLVSYQDVPGYQDGTFSIIIYKEAHVYIHSFLASPNPAVLNQGKASIDLSWNASAARLTLMPGANDVTDQSVYPTTIGKSTQFTLIAQGNSTSNYASSDVQVDIFPAINSMAASPQNVYYKDFPHDVLLDWSVNSNDNVTLINSINSNVQSLPSNYTTGVNVTQPQMFSILPDNSNLPLFIERNQVISAFQLQQQTVGLDKKPLAIALSPTANICTVVQAGSNQVLVLETITNMPYGAPISAGNQPVALAFSHDGRRFFVANGGDSTLSVFDVTFSNASSGYVFTKVADVTLSSAPVALGVSADDSTIFVISNSSGAQHLLATSLSGSGAGTLDVVQKAPDGNSYQVVSSVGFNQPVNALAVLPSAAQIFVVSTAAQSVFVVGYDSIQGEYQRVRTIGGFDSQDKPVDIDIAGHDAGTLLIVCSGTNSVYAVNKDVTSVSGKQKLAVGKGPSRVLVIESGAYAYVANTGDKTLSLIACFKGGGLCSILEKDLANKGAPTALTSSAEGSVIYAANGDSSLSAWNILTFAPGASKLSVPQPTSVTASTTYVVSWHNYNIQISQGAPGPGLKVYNRNTQTSTLVNATTKYTTFSFWPDDARQVAIATVFNDQNLYILETKKFTTSNFIAFSGSPRAQAVTTAISPFGNMIFVLSKDTGGAFNLTAISCDLVHNTYKVVATVNLFTQAASSIQSLAAVSDGATVFIADSTSQKLYIVSRQSSGGYTLESKSYSFTYLPRAMSCAPDDTQLYIWMNQGGNSAFARFDIAARELENFVLPGTVAFQVSGMTIAPDGSRLYLLDANRGVRVFSTDAMQNIENITLPNDASFPLSVAIAPDGSGLFTANALSDNISLVPLLAPSPSLLAKPKSEMLLAGADYQGIFLRKYIGQKPGDGGSSSGWCFSPDIQPSGVKAMPDPSVLGQQANYNTDFTTRDDIKIVLGQFNNVYARGLNTTAGPQKSRIYFYWVVSSVVQIPSSWSPYNFMFDQNLQNWLDVAAQKQNEIVYSPAPLSWKPDPNNPHYCLVAWVDNSANPSPPDLSQLSNFRTWDDVGNFIISHPNIAWRNTNDVAVPGQFMNAQIRVEGPSQGGTVTLGVKMDNIPTDGSATVQFTLINSNGTISYNSPVYKIITNTFSQTINWPANAPNPLLTYTYNPPGNKLQGGEKISAFAAIWPGASLMRRLQLTARESLNEVPGPRLQGGVQLMIVGSVRFNYVGK